MPGIDHLRVAAMIAAVFLTVGILALVETAEAAFPGVNGKIAFVSLRVTATNPTGDYEIFTMNPDGTGVTQLTFNEDYDSNPAVSADGTWEVYTMDADGNNQTNRSNNDTAEDESPSWSPSGNKIAFQSDRGGDYEIFVMKPDGTGRKSSSPRT